MKYSKCLSSLIVVFSTLPCLALAQSEAEPKANPTLRQQFEILSNSVQETLQVQKESEAEAREQAQRVQRAQVAIAKCGIDPTFTESEDDYYKTSSGYLCKVSFARAPVSAGSLDEKGTFHDNAVCVGLDGKTIRDSHERPLRDGTY